MEVSALEAVLRVKTTFIIARFRTEQQSLVDPNLVQPMLMSPAQMIAGSETTITTGANRGAVVLGLTVLLHLYFKIRLTAPKTLRKEQHQIQPIAQGS